MKSWPVCEICQFELRPNTPNPHQKDCSKADFNLDQPFHSNIAEVMQTPIWPHASTTDWRKNIVPSALQVEFKIDYVAAQRLSSFIEKTIASAVGAMREKVTAELKVRDAKVFEKGRASSEERMSKVCAEIAEREFPLAREWGRASALAEVAALVEGMKENNVCTCERKVCHCGRFPTGKEGDAWNAALNQVLASLQDKKDNK